MIIFPFVT